MDRDQERLRLKGEIAGLRVLAALARWEQQYRPDQERVPLGKREAERPPVLRAINRLLDQETAFGDPRSSEPVMRPGRGCR